FVEARAALGQIANSLQHDERGVALVEMKHRRVGAERLERANAADAENDFLLDARLAIAAVQPRGQLAVPWRVLFEIRVEEIQLDAPDPDTPHGDEHRAFAERHGGDARLAVGGYCRLDRRVSPVEPLVALFLPAFG